MNKTMKKVQLSGYGSPDVLQLVESLIPQPGPGEVLLKVQAIGVNYSDIQRRKNTYFQPTSLPYTLGHEAVGTIEAVGVGVTEPFVKGLRVLAILPGSGGYAEYVTGPAQYCVPLPPQVDAKAATAIFVQGTTARLLTSVVSGNLSGKTVVVNAAGGGVGSLLVQLAVMAGARVIAAAGDGAKRELAQKLGAAEAVDYSRPGWGQAVREITGGKGADVVFEMVGGEVYNESIKSLATGGHLIIYGAASGRQGSVHPEYFVDENLTQSGFNLAFYIGHKTSLWQAALGEVTGLIAGGKLQVQVLDTFSLADAAQAHRSIEARQTRGKVVLIP
jgi:NADPH2:quinone reductase